MSALYYEVCVHIARALESQQVPFGFTPLGAAAAAAGMAFHPPNAASLTYAQRAFTPWPPGHSRNPELRETR